MKIHIDFQIYDSNDPKQIIVLDTSIWGSIENKPSIIEIIPPGSIEKSILFYDKNAVNILNSQNLNVNYSQTDKTQYDLDDGVYEITVKGSPEDYNKKRYYLKTTTLQNELDNLLIKSYSDCKSCIDNNEDTGKILRYYNLISVAEALLRKGYNCESQDIIFKIQKFLKSKNCKRCPHKV